MDRSSNLRVGFRGALIAVCLLMGACSQSAQADSPFESIFSTDDCWLCSDKPLLGSLKNRPLAGDWTYSVGGEFRYRYMDEQNRLRPAGTTHNNVDLWRVVPFFEVGNDWITAHVEAIDASIFDNEIARLPIDENRADLLQYYLDVNLWGEPGDGMLRFRAGRQFLKLGSQYLVSPLPWANTYRDFEGFRLYWPDPLWDVDVFSVRPVNGAAVATQFRPTSRDLPDSSVWFTGVYVSRKQVFGGALDGYWFWNKEDQPLDTRHDGNTHTVGVRHSGTKPLASSVNWGWDAELGAQWGNDNFVTAPRRNVAAGFAAANSGVTFTKAPWTPAIKGIFWWGSGDNSPGTGTVHTINTLYPFGHFYWGILDNFNGANLVQYGVQGTIKPHDKLTLLAAWHWFDKANKEDFIYNIAGAGLGGATASRNIGHELDLIGTYAVNANLSVQLGYSWFWYGDAVNEQVALARGDAHQAYLMTTWGF